MRLDFNAARSWQPPSSFRRVRVIDAHTGGEPFRVVLDTPPFSGETILAKRRHGQTALDGLRKLLMWEPRGHADMYGCFLVEPNDDDADFGILFLHNEGYSSMCGHGIIAACKVVLETGLLPKQTPATDLVIDAPAGRIFATAFLEQGRVDRVAFRNVPSFVLELDAEVEVPDLGPVRYDLAYGGAFYAYVEAASVGLSCLPRDVDRQIAVGKAIKRAVMADRAIPHPFEEDLSFLYGVIFTGPAKHDERHSRHVCIFAEGEVDRSPTGTGVSGRLAILHRRGELPVEDSVVIESLTGSSFEGRIAETVEYGPHPAVVPEVTGRAFICGRNEILIDPQDEFPEGFLLR